MEGPMIFRKYYHRRDTKYQIPRERAFLNALHPFHGFPKVLSTGTDPDGEEWTDMTWCGTQVASWYEAGKLDLMTIYQQFRSLIDIMQLMGIKHRDLSRGNLLWSDRGAALVDFGISIWIWEPDVAPDYLKIGEWSCGPNGLTDDDRLCATLWQLKTGEVFDEPEWKAGKIHDIRRSLGIHENGGHSGQLPGRCTQVPLDRACGIGSPPEPH